MGLGWILDAVCWLLIRLNLEAGSLWKDHGITSKIFRAGVWACYKKVYLSCVQMDCVSVLINNFAQGEQVSE